MKRTLWIGIILIVLGVLGMSFQSVSYTTREKVIDIGALEVTADTRKTVDVPFIAGALAMATGIAFIVISIKKR